jgi:hypothetical protein
VQKFAIFVGKLHQIFDIPPPKKKKKKKKAKKRKEKPWP